MKSAKGGAIELYIIFALYAYCGHQRHAYADRYYVQGPYSNGYSVIVTSKRQKRKWEEEKRAYSSFSCHCLISPFYKHTYLYSMENAQHQEYFSFPFHIILQFWLLFSRSLLLSSCKCIDPFIGAQRSDAFKATVLCIRMCQPFIALSNILLRNNELIS